MKRCIQLAKNGLGTVYPNPLVGSVLVVNDAIIGEGWHKKAGESHAEVNAINSVKDVSLLKNATIYVSLEPCSHYGKTPPCANLIVESGIKNVVIGSVDANSIVAGKGIEHLEKNGCNVTVGILEEMCLELNKRFFTFHNKKRPFIILKWAETSDGFIDKIRKENKIEVNWISNSYSQQITHKMRAEEQAILVGTTTVLRDNPSLTTRNWFGKNPLRIVIDKDLKIPKSFKIFDQNAEMIILTNKNIPKGKNENFDCKKINFSENLTKEICKVLYENEIQSVIIEGGANTLQQFIDANLWDEAYVFVGNVQFETGLKAPIMNRRPNIEIKLKGDALTVYLNYNLKSGK